MPRWSAQVTPSGDEALRNVGQQLWDEGSYVPRGPGHIQRLADVGVTWKDHPTPELPVASAEVFVATALQFSFSLCTWCSLYLFTCVFTAEHFPASPLHLRVDFSGNVTCNSWHGEQPEKLQYGLWSWTVHLAGGLEMGWGSGFSCQVNPIH